MVLPGDTRTPLAGRHRGRRFLSCAVGEKGTKVVSQTKYLQPSLTLCRCLQWSCPVAGKSRAISLSVPKMWAPITCSRRGRTSCRNKEVLVQGNFPGSSLQVCFPGEV